MTKTKIPNQLKIHNFNINIVDDDVNRFENLNI
jgi:hypothetical protein